MFFLTYDVPKSDFLQNLHSMPGVLMAGMRPRGRRRLPPSRRGLGGGDASKTFAIAAMCLHAL